MSESTIPPLRRCTKCGVEYPATREYFYDERNASGLKTICKNCIKARSKSWREVNHERSCEAMRNWRASNAEYVRDFNRQRYLENREAVLQYQRNRRFIHGDRIREYDRRRYRKNPEKRRAYTIAWRKSTQYNSSESVRRWRLKNPHRAHADWSRRLARKRSLPDTLTHEQWQYAIDYFNGCCAVCGRQANDLFGTHTLAMDHWIPLNSPDCPGTVAANIIPLCNGQGGCNQSKKDKLAEDWLIQRFGRRNATEILKRITAYFDSLKQ